MEIDLSSVSTQDQSNASDPGIDAYKPGIDRTLLRENRRLSVEQRFEKLLALQRFAAELRRAGREGDVRNKTLSEDSDPPASS